MGTTCRFVTTARVATAYAFVAERRKPLPLPPQQAGQFPAPPNGEVDFGIVNLDFFVDGYNGTGIYKQDGPRKNLRLIAKIEDPDTIWPRRAAKPSSRT